MNSIYCHLCIFKYVNDVHDMLSRTLGLNLWVQVIYKDYQTAGIFSWITWGASTGIFLLWACATPELVRTLFQSPGANKKNAF